MKDMNCAFQSQKVPSPYLISDAKYIDDKFCVLIQVFTNDIPVWIEFENIEVFITERIESFIQNMENIIKGHKFYFGPTSI